MIGYWTFFSDAQNLLDYVFVFVEAVVFLSIYVLARRKRKFRPMMLLCAYVLETVYIAWRTLCTLDFHSNASATASVVLLAAEYVGYFQQGIFYLLMSRSRSRKTVLAGEYTPTIDVYVTTYDESLAILRRTLTACTYIDYPKNKLNIYVLDDGKRAEVRHLAEQIGVRYIARDTNEHAKAGNLNNALRQTNGELVLTLDADMVPKSYILQRMVGYFQRHRTGYVQAPQVFFNPDPFQHNLAGNGQLANEQDFFMLEMQHAKERYNATMYVGSNSLFSRQALESIGGFATGCITEDVATGMLVQAKGYKTYFVKDVLAKGLAPESFSEMLQQRDRWCRGSVQASKMWSPLTTPGLSFMQRMIYVSGAVYWYYGIQKLIYILAPLLFLDFGIRTMYATLPALYIFWLMKYVSGNLSFQQLSEGRSNPFWSHVYETATAPVLAWSVLSETLGIKPKNKFHVTQKGITTQTWHIAARAFVPQLVLLGMTMFGVGREIYLTMHGTPFNTYILINDFWAAYNVVGIVFGLFVSIEQPRQRKSERVIVKRTCTLQVANRVYRGHTIDISEGGARGEFELSTANEEMITGLLSIDGISEPIRVRFIDFAESLFEKRMYWSYVPQNVYQELVRMIYDGVEDIDRNYKFGKADGWLRSLRRTVRMKAQTVSKGRPRRANVEHHKVM